MAFLRTFVHVMFLALLLLNLTQAFPTAVTNVAPSPSPIPPPKTIECEGACSGRCAKSSRPRLCKRACGSCCFRCKCVPSGTSGNYETCPCYFNLKTRNNIRKCP